MIATTVIAAACGALVAAGVLLAILGTRPAPASPATGRRRRLRRPTQITVSSGWRRHRWPVAIVVAVVAWVLTSWPVVAIGAGAGVIAVPALLSSSRTASRSIGRVEALEEWARRLADVLALGVGLEQAIIASARTVPDPIRGEVTALAARLGARWPTETALRVLADDLDDALGDLVVAALVLGSRRRGPGLARALGALADSAAEEVATRRRIESDRAKPRATARAVTAITIGVLVVGLANRDYLAPYSDPLGQIVLALIAAAFAAALWWMKSMTTAAPEARLLTRATTGEDLAAAKGAGT